MKNASTNTQKIKATESSWIVWEEKGFPVEIMRKLRLLTRKRTHQRRYSRNRAFFDL